jgi:hypothetical protein
MIKIDGVESLEKTISGLVSDLKNIPAEIVKVLSTVRNQIVFDTTSGIDINGKPFEAYSDGYKKVRKEHHRQENPPSLTYTGDMLRAMKVFRIQNGGELRFNSSSANNLAVKHNEGKGVPKREFFGMNNKHLANIEMRIFGSVKL